MRKSAEGFVIFPLGRQSEKSNKKEAANERIPLKRSSINNARILKEKSLLEKNNICFACLGRSELNCAKLLMK